MTSPAESCDRPARRFTWHPFEVALSGYSGSGKTTLVEGLLRQLAVDGSKAYFDTNPTEHHHFFVEGENRVMDIDSGPVTISNLPEPPEGMEVANVDIIVRLRPKA